MLSNKVIEGGEKIRELPTVKYVEIEKAGSEC